ncbi:zinc transporter, ZIP family [Parageobacillus thermantarcticus]|uniref:Zinc transporter, ZIP family n=1 Tax=Parageobacillus thermantarcticus TaxID=186116 RepID=A0A1I0T925_9BACL|nr:zinc transporter, ZIP family [Parageobacillus thermantarcticus]
MQEVLIGSILSALSTGLGAVPILFLAKSITHRWRDILLAFSAGIMMAASMMSLIPEALQAGRRVDYPIKSKGYRKKSTFPVECE